MSDPILESGYERDSLSGHLSIRWWFYLHAPVARPQRPRLGVEDNGFRFARGGRCSTAGQAEYEIARARMEANQDWQRWTRQPSHRLSPTGELIPLGPVAGVLEAG